ncbi:Hypp1486 [Branchiostoma lanceolatum]|uniref:Hypp1486 protein n=1 Tax=Branchiostoma lanceolatum TaxID=7740 RepID=A0A8K0ENI9_BRALA|nr:Hypp1486 [Branchiostoma lanceolatum]
MEVLVLLLGVLLAGLSAADPPQGLYTAEGVTYVGCFEHGQPHNEEVLALLVSADCSIIHPESCLTPATCIDLCQNTSTSYIYIGLKYPGQCFCDSVLRVEVNQTDSKDGSQCDGRCAHDLQLDCGGGYNMLVYRMSNIPPLTSPVTDNTQTVPGYTLSTRPEVVPTTTYRGDNQPQVDIGLIAGVTGGVAGLVVIVVAVVCVYIWRRKKTEGDRGTGTERTHYVNGQFLDDQQRSRTNQDAPEMNQPIPTPRPSSALYLEPGVPIDGGTGKREVEGVEYIGCFEHGESYPAEVLQLQISDCTANHPGSCLTPATCIDSCQNTSTSYIYVGLKFPGLCFCDSTLRGVNQTDSVDGHMHCDGRCTKNETLACGNSYNMLVYRVNFSEKIPQMTTHVGTPAANSVGYKTEAEEADTTPERTNERPQNSIALIAGATAGGAAVLIAGTVVGVCLWRKKFERRQTDKPGSSLALQDVSHPPSESHSNPTAPPNPSNIDALYAKPDKKRKPKMSSPDDPSCQDVIPTGVQHQYATVNDNQSPNSMVRQDANPYDSIQNDPQYAVVNKPFVLPQGTTHGHTGPSSSEFTSERTYRGTTDGILQYSTISVLTGLIAGAAGGGGAVLIAAVIITIVCMRLRRGNNSNVQKTSLGLGELNSHASPSQSSAINPSFQSAKPNPDNKKRKQAPNTPIPEDPSYQDVLPTGAQHQYATVQDEPHPYTTVQDESHLYTSLGGRPNLYDSIEDNRQYYNVQKAFALPQGTTDDHADPSSSESTSGRPYSSPRATTNGIVQYSTLSVSTDYTTSITSKAKTTEAVGSMNGQTTVDIEYTTGMGSKGRTTKMAPNMEEQTGVGIGLIAGAAGGGGAVLIVAVIIAIVCMRRSRGNKSSDQGTSVALGELDSHASPFQNSASNPSFQSTPANVEDLYAKPDKKKKKQRQQNTTDPEDPSYQDVIPTGAQHQYATVQDDPHPYNAVGDETNLYDSIQDDPQYATVQKNRKQGPNVETNPLYGKGSVDNTAYDPGPLSNDNDGAPSVCEMMDNVIYE